ncbi:MAG: aminotransferase class I/II-fold pyridoxal phosphate-dependent enzyme [Elusimicrobia bacterium]|nr:aminotransferase class I/II-fold pyridoxal phosphate-dependent enzyme [Candidatus Obscuribacterium magneticum]
MRQPISNLQNLPPYIFGRIKTLALEARAKNLDIIDLSMGNPDLPTPQPVIDRLVDTVQNHHATHRYPQAKGMPKFRQAVSSWMKKRFDVDLDPAKEICALVGSKEGIANLCSAYLEPGEIALVPSPCYPVHIYGVILAQGKPYLMPINEKNGYLPELDKIPDDIARKAKILFLNYPNNPTTAVIEDSAYLKEVVAFAKKYEILVCYDNAYCEIAFDDFHPGSFFSIPGARDVGLEFHSFSKSFNMAGWRLGWACGDEKILGPLEKIKSYRDYGVPTFIQLSGVKALELWPDFVKQLSAVYQRRRDYLYDGLTSLGWKINKPKATMYIWAQIPDSFRSMGSLTFCEKLIKETGIALAPGVGFGEGGEGFVRFALVTRDSRLYDLLLRLKKFQGVTGVNIKKPKKV